LLEAQDRLRRYGGLIRHDGKEIPCKTLTNSSSSLLSFSITMKWRLGLCAHETTVCENCAEHLF
jgi:hypothetical protein